PAGGALNASGTSSRPTDAAARWSAHRHAIRATHSGGSASVAATVSPPSAFTPQSSTSQSSTEIPAISTRCMKIAVSAFALSAASGQENATRVSPDQPAGYASSALYVSVA